jgi:hypothetical protein
MAGLQLTAERIGVSLDVPGGSQTFKLDQTASKFELKNTFLPVSGGANNNITFESRNIYEGGFRWKHATPYNAVPSSSPGTYKLCRFINNGSETETDIFSIGSTGNVTFNNDVTVNGNLSVSSFSIPTIIDVAGTSQTFEYNGNHTANFNLKNTYAAAVGTPSTVALNFVNSTTGGYKFVHTSSTTDTAGIGTLKLKLVNSVGTTGDVFTASINPGSGVSQVVFHGDTYFQADNIFNLGGSGACSFNAPTFFNSTIQILDPVEPYHAVSLGYMETYVANAVATDPTTLTGAVTGTGATTINTTLSDTINMASNTQSFVRAGNSLTTFKIKNSLAATSGNPSFVDLKFENSTTGGFSFRHISSTTDVSGVGEFNLNLIDNSGASTNAYALIRGTLGTAVHSFAGQFVFMSAVLNCQSDFQSDYGNNRFNFTSGGSYFYGEANFNGPTVFSSDVEVPTPTTGLQAANKNYVDTSISSTVGAIPVELTGAVTGINSLGSPVFTSLAATLPLTGATQLFSFSLNSNVNYNIKNTLSATTGTPSTVALSLLNGINGGFKLSHTSTSTDTAGLGTYRLRAINSSGTETTVYTASVNSSTGIPDLTVSGTANFSNLFTITSNATSSGINLNNTNSASTSNEVYFISPGGVSLFSVGLNNNTNEAYIYTRTATILKFGMNGVEVARFNTSGNFGIGTSNPNLAKLHIVSGVQNIAGEDSVIRAISSSSSCKLELQNTTLTTGKLWEVRSNANGSFSFVERTTGNLNLLIDVANVALGAKCLQQNTTGLYNTAVGDLALSSNTTGTRNSCFGAGAGEMLTQGESNVAIGAGALNEGILSGQNCAIGRNAFSQLEGYENTAVGYLSGNNHAQYTNCTFLGSRSDASVNNLTNATAIGYNAIVSASNTLVLGNGANVAIGLSYANAPLQFSNAIVNKKIALYETANNNHQFYGWGLNNGVLRYQVDSTSANHVFYAATSSTTSNELFRINGIGNVGVGTIPTLGRIHVLGGVQNTVGEDTGLCLESSSGSAKLELRNTAVGGRLFEFQSNSSGFFEITDRTGSVGRLRITSTGDTIFSGTTFGRRCSGTISMQNNAVTTTVVTAGTYVKLNGTTAASNLNQLTSPVSNRITFTGATSSVALITASVTAVHSGGGGDELTFALYKNGTQISTSIMSSQSANNYINISLVTTTPVVTNDYIELWVTSSVSNRIVTPKHLNITFTTV